MLRYNPGGGRLEFSRQQKEGKEYYCYKITGKKALGSIYSAITIGERQIRNILIQLFAILEAGKEYLLAEEDFLLAPGYMFATLPQMQLEVCYVPGYGMPLKEQLEGLFEYLLNRVDYEDKGAVELLYDCYMLCMQGTAGITEIKKKLEDTGEEERRMDVPDESVPERTVVKIRDVVQEPEKPSSYFSWLTDFFSPRRKREIPVLAQKQEEYIALNSEVRSIETPQENVSEQTVLLATVPFGCELCLVNKASGEVIEIHKFPYYIGSVTAYADYVLKKQGVSRIHCCINKKGEEYVLSDLNSTNGTYCDGQEVLPGKEAVLSQNATISIADVEFSVDFSCH